MTGAILFGAALIAGACSAADVGTAPDTGAPNADFAEYCEATFKIESYFAGDTDVDFETATPAEIGAALKTYLDGAKPLIDAVLPLVPAEIKEPVDVQVAAFEKGRAGADPEEVFDTPETKAAEDKIHAFDLENCGWNEARAEAVDYGFKGLPDELEAGRTSIDLTNMGKELHEIQLLSKKAGVPESFDEILALPEEEAMKKVTGIGGAFAPPGDSDYVVVNLAKGDYLFVCFIPQGLTSEDAKPSPDAKPHFALGMKKELTVK